METTKDIATALSEEATIPAKTMTGLINKNIDKKLHRKEADVARRNAKNSQGEKSVSFSNAPETIINKKKNIKKRKAKSTPSKKKQNQTVKTNHPEKRQIRKPNAPPNKKRRSNDHPNTNKQSKHIQPTEETNNTQTSNKKKRRKTFESKKWIRPKEADLQEGLPKEA